jgi:cell division protein ZapA
MAQAVVSIAGRTYRMSCDEGEESHIENLARLVEAKIEDLRGSFGEIGEQRIVVMAAITLADELHTSRQKLKEADALVEKVREEAAQVQSRQQEWAEWAAQCLDKATEKVADATKALNED